MVSGERPGQQLSQPESPPELKPPGRLPPSSRPSNARRFIWVALSLLIFTGLAVVFVLPGLVVPINPERPDEQLAITGKDDSKVRDVAAERERAEQTLQQFLRLQAALARENAPVWGAQAWHEALQLTRSGDRQFGERQFKRAAEYYARALADLQALQASRSERLEQALSAAWEALHTNAAEQAVENFQSVLAIDPGHQEAKNGLAQARVRHDVVEQVEIATAAENAKDWAKARDAYLKALDLDQGYSPASAGLERVDRNIALDRFNLAMNAALSALDGGRLSDAEKSLQKAAAIFPDNPSLQDTRLRLKQARQASALKRLRLSAQAAVRAEMWSQAVELYKRTLKIDRNAGFARQGLIKAEQRAALNQRFDHYLGDPERLFSPEPLANAEQLVAGTQNVPASEPLLLGKLQRLQVLIRKASLPLKVHLFSDGETEVVVYHVGRLGRFIERQLELRPGVYTAVGSRPGFRDVRREFRVNPDNPVTTVHIRCEEAI